MIWLKKYNFIKHFLFQVRRMSAAFKVSSKITNGPHFKIMYRAKDKIQNTDGLHFKIMYRAKDKIQNTDSLHFKITYRTNFALTIWCLFPK